MILVAGISNKADKKSVPNFNKIDASKNTPVNMEIANKEELKAELKGALNDAVDILEGKKPRKTLRDIFNG